MLYGTQTTKAQYGGRTGCGLCGVAQLEEAVKPVMRVDSDARFDISHLQGRTWAN